MIDPVNYLWPGCNILQHYPSNPAVQTLTGENHSDKELVDRSLTNDRRAFGLIIAKTERMVASIVHRMVSNEEDRRDIAQDIYVKAFRNLPAFKYESRLSTWICRISYNTCIDYLRKKKISPLFRQDVQPDTDDEKGGWDQQDVPSTGQTADGLVMKKELSGILKTEIGKLSPVYQTLITLFHTEELSYGEIQQITGLPDGTIKSYLSRARKTLRDNLLTTYSKRDL